MLQFGDNDSAETFGGIAESIICIRWVHVFSSWIENKTKVGDRKIQKALQWKLARMNQSEIDELLRDAHEHGYTEIVGSPDSGGCASLNEKLRLYRDTQISLKTNVDEDSVGEQPMSNKAFIETVIGVIKKSDIQVRVTEGVRYKGSKKRLISEKEKAIINAKKGSRKCGGCGEYVVHNARTCPNKTK
ncbi:hypothetical protein LXL04_009105 [Taraxacum kok-saghyz]